MNMQIPAKEINCSGLWAVSRASHRIKPTKETPASTLKRKCHDHIISSVNEEQIVNLTSKKIEVHPKEK